MLIHLWHTFLNMPKHDRKWHDGDVAKELEELNQEKHFFKRISEKSDVTYAYTRAKWDNYKDIKWPLDKLDYMVGVLYMFPKYTSRRLFFYIAGKRCGNNYVKEVRNPRKDWKLANIARDHNIDPEIFKKECKKLSRFWIFFR